MKWLEKHMFPTVKLLFECPPPFMIHGDNGKIQRFCYPTHTHGLCDLELPEIFINASCFGPIDNAKMINEIAASLIINTEVRNLFMNFERLELITGWFPEDQEMVIGLRKVSVDFLGVKAAYNEDTPSKFGYAQLYVVGDDHVLVDEYYSPIIERNTPCTGVH